MKQSPYIVKHLEQVKSDKRSIKKIIRNLRNRSSKLVDQEFYNAHHHVFDKIIRCLDCANCCHSLGPRLTDKDIDRLSRHLKLKPSQFTSTYLKTDEDADFVFKSMPCPFLNNDNYCRVYEQRPRACREYPHTDRNKMHKMLHATEKNAHVCPAVYLILKQIQ